MDPSATPNVDGQRREFFQNVVVMRHGDRIDNFEPLWTTTAARPWDPPLVEKGRVRAFRTGRDLKSRLGFPIHRVFVSPFLRCVQTASEVVSALCAVDEYPDVTCGDRIAIDSSKVKVRSLELHVCNCSFAFSLLYLNPLCLVKLKIIVTIPFCIDYGYVILCWWQFQDRIFFFEIEWKTSLNYKII